MGGIQICRDCGYEYPSSMGFLDGLCRHCSGKAQRKYEANARYCPECKKLDGEDIEMEYLGKTMERDILKFEEWECPECNYIIKGISK